MCGNECDDNVQRTRTYDVSLTYDYYYQTPKVWLIGYDENGTPLTPESVFDDISSVRVISYFLFLFSRFRPFNPLTGRWRTWITPRITHGVPSRWTPIRIWVFRPRSSIRACIPT